jgi:hypothetical protein
MFYLAEFLYDPRAELSSLSPRFTFTDWMLEAFTSSWTGGMPPLSK